jgi:SHOCT-like protein
MSLETRKVLDMLAEGKITAADADKLLEKLQASSGAADPTHPEAEPSAQTLRTLRIVVDEPGRKQVNIRMPLSFVRSGAALVGVLPRPVTEKLKERGIDLGALSEASGDELVTALRDLHLDVDKGDGKTVRIFCE